MNLLKSADKTLFNWSRDIVTHTVVGGIDLATVAVVEDCEGFTTFFFFLFFFLLSMASQYSKY